MKKFIASAGALLLATAMLASCSAYNNPEKYIELPDLKEITISRSDINADWEEQKAEILEKSRKGNFKEIAEAAKNGDQVNIDYEGKAADSNVTLSETTLSGMKGEDYDLVLGSGSFIGAYTKDGEEVTKSFEEQLEGLKAGNTKEVTVTFPDDYDTEELQGVKAIFTVTVNTVSRLSVDEDCLVKIEYAFKDPDAKTEGEEDSTEEENDNTASQSEDTESDEAEWEFTDLFKDGSFEFDYAEEPDDKLFNEIFKIADFRDDFLGKNLYQEFVVKVTIPEDVEDDFQQYAGREISINFTIDSATVLPEWNDEFIKEYTNEEYTTVSAFEEAQLKDIEMNAAYEAVFNAVTVIEYPKSETEKAYKSYVEQLVNQQVQSTANKTIDQLTSAELEALIDDATYQTIYNQAASYAMSEVKNRLFMEYMVNLLEVSLSKDEYKAKLQEMYDEYTVNMYYFYSYYGVMFADIDDMEDYYGKDSLELQFKFEKVQEMLPEKITITD